MATAVASRALRIFAGGYSIEPEQSTMIDHAAPTGPARRAAAGRRRCRRRSRSP